MHVEKNTKNNEDKIRIELYDKSKKDFNFENEKKISKEQIAGSKEIIEGNDNILDIFNVYLRDQIKITIIDEDGNKYYDNLLLSTKDNNVWISNPFITYANKIFPDIVFCSYEDEGTEYSFNLEKNKKNDNSISISCSLPETIQVLKRRGNSRYTPKDPVAIGLYLEKLDKELIGQMSDISKVGIGLSFQESTLDSDVLSLLTEDKEEIFSLIIDNDGHYLTVLVRVKHSFHLRKDKKVLLGAEFILAEEENENLDIFFKRVKKEHHDKKILNKTKHLILSSKMGMKL